MRKMNCFILFTLALGVWSGLLAQPSTDNAITSSGNSVIMGKVLDESGEIIIHAVVSVKGLRADTDAHTARTDSAGNYCLHSLAPGIYIVRAEANAYLPEYYQNAPNLLSARPLTLGRVDTIKGVDFSLSKGGAITGVVTTVDNQPLANAEIVAWPHTDVGIKIKSRTDAQGAYTLQGLASGSYIVSAAKTGYLTEIYHDAVKRVDATPVAVTAPDITDHINFTLNLAAAITGVISNEQDGTPIAGAQVTAFAVNAKNTGRWTVRVSAQTDRQGGYIIPLVPGNYIVQTLAAGFAPEYYENASSTDSASTVAVKDSAHTRVNMALTPWGSLSGQVTDAATGQPIGRAHVSLFTERRTVKRFFETVSDSLGAFTFRALPADRYLVQAEAAGYLPEFWQEADSVQKAVPVKIENNQALENIDFTLGQGARLRGLVVKAADATPIPAALVTATSENGRITRLAPAGRDGSWTIGGLPAGKYLVTAVAFGYVQQWYNGATGKREATPVNVQSEESKAGIDFKLSQIVREGAVISGLVTDDSTSLPIRNATVIATSISRMGKYERAVTDSNGYYKISGLAAGRYILSSQARNYIAEYYKDARSWRKAEIVALTLNDVVTDINFGLAPQVRGGYLISGKVLEKNGRAAAFALVQVAVKDQVLAATVCEEDGQYALSELPGDDYLVSASTPGYQDAALSSAVVNVGSGKNVYDASILMVEEITTNVDKQTSAPQQFSLDQNYPNPFNPSTEIRFSLAEKADVTLKVYNLMGQVIATLYQGECNAGSYKAMWDGLDQHGLRSASGMYLYRLQAMAGTLRFEQTRRMILMK
jgi:hypothetical protein